jgi:hypothetical protein
MNDNNNILILRQIAPRLLYTIVVLAASCSLMILPLLSSSNIVLAQEEDDLPVSATPTTSIPTNADFNFAVAGDWGCGSGAEDTVDNIEDKNPELVLGLGDFTYSGDFVDCWFDIIQPIDSIMKIVIGNHESEDEIEELMNHFSLPQQYYSFDYQNVHFIALASESEYLDISTDTAQEQLAFVKSDLEKASANPDIDWIIPFFHRIMYAEVGGGLEDQFDHNLVDIYHPLFEKYGVNLVLQAHTHTYERTYPLKFNSEDTEEPIVTSKDSSNYRSADGLVIATVGTAGVGTAGVYPTRLFISDALAPVQYTDTRGFLNVDVSSDGTTLVGTFYDNDNGDIKDQFTITKSSTSSVPTSTVGEEENDNADDQMAIEEELDNELLDDNNEDDEVSSSVGENGNEESSDGN